MFAASLGFCSAMAVAEARPSPELVKWAAGYGYHVKLDVKGNEVFCATLGRAPFRKSVCAPQALMALCFENKKKPIFGQDGYYSVDSWEESCHS